MLPGPLVPQRPVQTLDLGCWGALTHRRGGLSNGLPPAPGAMENLGAPALPPTCSAGAQFDPATRDYSFSPPAKRGERVGERIPRTSNSRLDPLNWAGLNVGQCVSPAPFPAVPFPACLTQGGAGETHCPTLRFMGRRNKVMANKGCFPIWRPPLPVPLLPRRRGRPIHPLMAVWSCGHPPELMAGESPVHPLCIWTNNVNAAVAAACCPVGFSGTISLVS